MDCWQMEIRRFRCRRVSSAHPRSSHSKLNSLQSNLSDRWLARAHPAWHPCQELWRQRLRVWQLTQSRSLYPPRWYLRQVRIGPQRRAPGKRLLRPPRLSRRRTESARRRRHSPHCRLAQFPGGEDDRVGDCDAWTEGAERAALASQCTWDLSDLDLSYPFFLYIHILTQIRPAPPFLVQAQEWLFFQSGTARATVFIGAGNARTFDFSAGDTAVFPSNAGTFMLSSLISFPFKRENHPLTQRSLASLSRPLHRKHLSDWGSALVRAVQERPRGRHQPHTVACPGPTRGRRTNLERQSRRGDRSEEGEAVFNQGGLIRWGAMGAWSNYSKGIRRNSRREVICVGLEV